MFLCIPALGAKDVSAPSEDALLPPGMADYPASGVKCVKKVLSQQKTQAKNF